MLGAADFEFQWFNRSYPIVSGRKHHLFSGRIHTTLYSKQIPEKDETVTTLQVISILYMPVMGLVVAGAVLFYDWKFPPNHPPRDPR